MKLIFNFSIVWYYLTLNIISRVNIKARVEFIGRRNFLQYDSTTSIKKSFGDNVVKTDAKTKENDVSISNLNDSSIEDSNIRDIRVKKEILNRKIGLSSTVQDSTGPVNIHVYDRLKYVLLFKTIAYNMV